MNRTVHRAFTILDFVAANPQGVCLKDISESLELSKSSAYVIVQSLLNLGYLESSKYNSKRYSLGVSAYTLGMKYISKIDYVSLALPEMKKIAEKWDRTSFLGILKGNKIIYIQKYIPPSSIIASCQLGAQKDAHSTALGKAIIANRKDNNRIIDTLSFKPICENTITDRQTFKAQLETVRTKGYALDDRENDNSLKCIAAPIFDNSGEAIAAISLTGLITQDGDPEKIATDIIASTRKISTSLGYLG